MDSKFVINLSKEDDSLDTVKWNMTNPRFGTVSNFMSFVTCGRLLLSRRNMIPVKTLVTSF